MPYRYPISAIPGLEEVGAGSQGWRNKLSLRVWTAVGGLGVRIVLEIVLTHLFVTIVSTHTFDACIGKILTRIEEL